MVSSVPDPWRFSHEFSRLVCTLLPGSLVLRVIDTTFVFKSNLFPVDARLTKAWDSRDELREMRVLGSQAKDSLR